METQIHDSCDGTKRSFEVGLFRSEDAEGVARLFRSVHGEDYPIKIFYDPAKLIGANQEGDYYSIVARSTDGEIIGIHNLFRSAPSRAVYEWGVGLVLKEWRSIGVSGAIERYMMESVVPELGMHTVFGEPVTIHLHMQKHSEKYGFQPTALEVGLMPGEAYSGEGVISNRVSTCRVFVFTGTFPRRSFCQFPTMRLYGSCMENSHRVALFLKVLNPFLSAPFPSQYGTLRFCEGGPHSFL